MIHAYWKSPIQRTHRARVIRAAKKEKLVAKLLKIEPDGTITLSLAEPSHREINLDVSLDDLTNEWDKISGADK